jgi:hypothetical protein
MARENFPPKVRKLIEAAAGHQCSFPACNRRTTGRGPTSDYASNSGYAAHIYAASGGGPRGQGGLSEAELKSAGNGIWLCGIHAKLIDNNRGKSYPPETLHSYKDLHEARVLLEHEGLYPPIGWLHELTIVQGPVFAAPQKVQLSKLNLIYGSNCTGKTALTEWITGFLDPEPLKRWTPAEQQPLILQLTLLNPKLQHLRLKIDGRKLQYFVDGKPVAFIPIGFKIFKPQRLNFSIKDDREMLAAALAIPVVTVESLIEEVNSFTHAKASNLRFELDTDDEGNKTSRYVLRADLPGTAPGLTLRGLSGREGECILLELATAAARLAGKYCPTLLVFDYSISIIFEGFFDFYSHHLLDPINQFQTLMCIAERNLDLNNVKWNGWQVIRTNGRAPCVTLTQDVRAA